MMMRIKNSLFLQVILALILGLIVGVIFPNQAQNLKPLGDLFIRFIQLLIAPIVFCVVVNGISGVGNIKKVGTVGIKTIFYFECVTTIALALGLLLGLNSNIGMGMNIDPSSLDASAISVYTERAQTISQAGGVSFLMNLVPTTVIGAFAKGDILQVLVFSIIFACSLNLVKDKASIVVRAVSELSTVFFKAMGIIVRFAPVGVFGAVAFTVGKYGLDSLGHLGALVGLYFVTCILFIIVVLGGILRLCGINLFQFLRYMREELMIVFATTASDSVLPQIMKKLENMGIKSSTVSDLFMIIIVSMIASKGAHGVPGSAIVILAATLSAIPAIPMIGLVLILSIDWFIGIARAVTNIIGNCVATIVIAKWEGDLNIEQANKILSNSNKEKLKLESVIH